MSTSAGYQVGWRLEISMPETQDIVYLPNAGGRDFCEFVLYVLKILLEILQYF